MKHWRIEDVAWDQFDPKAVDPALVPLVKAAAMVERNGKDYARYLGGVFHDDPDFRKAADHWAEEEVQHGDALAKWAELADPAWNFAAAFDRYRAGYTIKTDADASIRGSRTGELIARCMVETGTSSYYTALAEATSEPVLKQVCKLIAADEYRHFKLFYDHMRRYLARENLGVLTRLRIAARADRRVGGRRTGLRLPLRQRAGVNRRFSTIAAQPPTWRVRWGIIATVISSVAPA